VAELGDRHREVATAPDPDQNRTFWQARLNLPDNDYVLDQNMIAQNYDYEGLAFWVRTAEPRTN
jgi:hypothetical protein